MDHPKKSRVSLPRKLSEQSEYKVDKQSLEKALKLNDNEVLEEIINTLTDKYENQVIDIMIDNLFKD